MINKRIIFILFLLLVASGTIASVSASGLDGDVVNASCDDAGIDDSIVVLEEGDDSDSLEMADSNLSDGFLQADDSGDVPLAAGSNRGTFTELQNKINNAPKGSTIYLDKDYYYNKDFGSKNGIKITKPITIDGRGHTIDGDKESALLLIFKTKNVVLKNIVFSNGDIGDLGSVGIFYSNNVKFSMCSFGHNVAECGGAVFLAYSNFSSFVGCDFEHNRADYGGAIYLACCTDSSFVGCDFEHNRADYGGAVYLGGIGSNFESCSFSDNFAYRGGAIVSIQSSLNVAMTNFSNNSAAGGGDIFSEFSMISLSDSLFCNSTATLTSGGSLSFKNDYVQIIGCTFENCSCRSYGGGAVFCSNSILDCNGSTFNSNEANYGGAICSLNTKLTVKNDTFYNNSASFYGGAIYIIYGSIIVDSSVFLFSKGLYGGCMFIRSPHEIKGISNNYFLYSTAYAVPRIYVDEYYGEIPQVGNVYEEVYFAIGEFIAALKGYNEQGLIYEYVPTDVLTYIISNSNEPVNNLSFYDNLRNIFISNYDFLIPSSLNYTCNIFEEECPNNSTIFINSEKCKSLNIVYDSVHDKVEDYDYRRVNIDFYDISNSKISYLDLIPRMLIVSDHYEHVMYYFISNTTKFKGWETHPTLDDGTEIGYFSATHNDDPYACYFVVSTEEFFSGKLNGKFHVNFSGELCSDFGNIYELEGNYNPVPLFNCKYSTNILPSQYDSRDYGFVTPVVDQLNGGNCWAFAGIATLEACLKKVTGKDYDLSENNAKNLMTTSSIYGLNLDANAGGYDTMFMSYLASWLGPIHEYQDIYDDSSLLSIVYPSIFHIQDISFLSPRKNGLDNDEFKNAIMNTGAVAVIFNWTTGKTSKGFHAVSLVGWDDDYDGIDCLGNHAKGAWIFKNSWGDQWGDEGFGYLSYEQKLSGEIAPYLHAYTFIFNDSEYGYQNIYQYDFAGVTDYLTTDADVIYYKNKFKAKEDEFLFAFSTYFEKPTYFTFSVRINGEDIIKDDNNQSIVSSIHYSPAGYHTIDLGYSLALARGDEFEIVIGLVNAGGETYVPVCQADELYKLTYPSNVSFLSYNGEDWIDLYDLNSNNKFAYGGNKMNTSQVACIKAFTNNWRGSDINAYFLPDAKVGYDYDHSGLVMYDFYLVPLGEGICIDLDFYGESTAIYENYAEIKVNDNVYYVNIEDNNTFFDIFFDKKGYYEISAKLKSNYYESYTIKVDVVVDDSLWGTFSRLKKIINDAEEGSTIYLDKNYCIDAKFEDSLIKIDKSLTINGNGHILYAHSKSGILGLYGEECNVTLKNIVFKNGNADYGGAIYSNANLTIVNCNFVDNSAFKGSAIYSGGNYLNISDSTFKSSQKTELIYHSNDFIGIGNHQQGELYLKNNKMETAAGSAAIYYDYDDIAYNAPLNLVFVNAYAIKGDHVYICQLENDDGNTLRRGAINVTLANQNNMSDIINLKIEYDSDLGGYVLNTSLLDSGVYRLDGGMFESYPGDFTVKAGMLNVVDRMVLDSSDLTKTYGKTNGLTVTLKDDNGNVAADTYITVELGGKTYRIKTDSKGKASLPVNLVPKTYAATISYAGNENYSSASIKVKVVVKKAPPKITAYKKTFKLKTKTKKYTITLKNNLKKAMKNVKVTIKVNGKTYTAKTNSKGKATFKITKLNKKGSFTATVKYGGNKYYKSVTKKVKITVKK